MSGLLARYHRANRKRYSAFSSALILLVAAAFAGQAPVAAMSAQERLNKAFAGISFVDDPCSGGGSSSGQTVIVIDPGHSGTAKVFIDPATNLRDPESTNSPEKEDVFDVAKLVEAKLQTDGYKVLLTKASASDTVSFRQRADLANQNHAALAISIHDQSGPPSGGSGGLPFASANNHVYIQQVGLYRVNQLGEKITFTNKAVADLSAKYGNIFTAERTAAEGHAVDIDQMHSRAGIADGNIWQVQLLAEVPWIYNEVGGVSSGGSGARPYGLSNEDKQKYAQGLINGIEKSVPVRGGGNAACAPAGGVAGILAMIVKYAWPDYRPTNGSNGDPLNKKSEYENAVRLGGYNGDPCTDLDRGGGIDCGAFVTHVMRDSGADPDYNKNSCNTTCQLQYLQDNSGPGGKYTKVSPNARQPGDIAIKKGHTYFYIGDALRSQGFNWSTASASQCERAPMAGPDDTATEFEWYRLN